MRHHHRRNNPITLLSSLNNFRSRNVASHAQSRRHRSSRVERQRSRASKELRLRRLSRLAEARFEACGLEQRKTLF
jgi:hypothetical protein